MTQPFLEDFHDRKRQARHYLGVVLTAERLAIAGRTTRAQERRLLTLRAGTFLLLYNLIEASVRGAIEAIHDQITTEEVHFSDLKLQLRRETVRLFKTNTEPTVYDSAADFPAAFVAAALGVGVKLSGNVDAKVIRELGVVYDFSCKTDASRTWDGADLLTIKTARNDLSHGRRTFEEVGRGFSAPELSKIARRSMVYIGDILLEIASYIDNKRYLDGMDLNVVDDGSADGFGQGGRNGIPD